ncbi:MAG: DUF5658 family protein [Fuerstiella sp.]
MFLSHFDRYTVAAGSAFRVTSWGTCLTVLLMTIGASQQVLGFQKAGRIATSDFNLVFVNGEYVESPYEVQQEGNDLFVNGHRVQVSEASVSAQPEREGRNRRPNGDWQRGGGGGGGYGGGRRGQNTPQINTRTSSSPTSRFARELHSKLQAQGLIVVFDGYPVRNLAIGDEGLSELLLLGSSVTDQQLLDWDFTDSSAEIAVWSNWLSSYEISSEASSRLQTIRDHFESMEAEYHSGIENEARLEQYAYPLTVLGMLLGVIALGYLLQWAGNGLNRHEVTAESERYVVIALCMMACMAAVDLIWTVLAGQAGQMKEINPLAASMIESPSQLALFKLLATGVGFSILYIWRQRQQIRKATWWMCLVSVLLTFRWVMFDSLRM